ncbi:MAG: hypothetical protein PVSMB1_16680 [Gemmatimonadaceae bacterium]
MNVCVLFSARPCALMLPSPAPKIIPTFLRDERYVRGRKAQGVAVDLDAEGLGIHPQIGNLVAGVMGEVYRARVTKPGARSSQLSSLHSN